MLDKGVYVIGFSYPVVPQGKARIRSQISAAHTREDLDFAVAMFAEAKREMGLLVMSPFELPSMQHWVMVLSLGGVAVSAVSGALAAGRKRMDLFGVVVLAGATALGGGTVRDVILGAYPIFWVAAPENVYVVVAAAILTFIAVRRRALPENLLLLADAFGLAFFTLMGVEKALATAPPAWSRSS